MAKGATIESQWNVKTNVKKFKQHINRVRENEKRLFCNAILQDLTLPYLHQKR